MDEIGSTEKMLKKIEELIRIAELPGLYIADYFIDLRNEVDLFVVPNQLINLENEKKKDEWNEIWRKIISKINALETKCIKKRLNLTANKERIVDIKMFLNSQKNSSFYLKDIIEEEEISLFKVLFSNLTIKFLEGKLIIVNDESIRQTTFKKR